MVSRTSRDTSWLPLGFSRKRSLSASPSPDAAGLGQELRSLWGASSSSLNGCRATAGDSSALARPCHSSPLQPWKHR